MTDYSSFFTKNLVNCLKSFIPNYTFKRINFKSKSKKKFDPVTVFDLKIEKKLHNLILNKYPKSNFIGEESINKNKRNKDFLTWVVDPIDGTKNFLIGSPVWSNLVGLCIGKKPLFGLAFFPILKRYYFSDSKKTYLFKNLKNKSTLKSSRKKDLKNSIIVTNTINTIKKKKF